MARELDVAEHRDRCEAKDECRTCDYADGMDMCGKCYDAWVEEQEAKAEDVAYREALR
jgi:hypothetical protein